MQRIRTFLWFDDKAEEAAEFYTSIFGNSKILSTMRYGDAGPGPKGSVMTVTFQLDGQEFIALNGGPHFTFSPAISLFVTCQSQAEVDDLWSKLSAGGKTQQCGWLQDRFGVSWQIVPDVLSEMLRNSEKGNSRSAMQAMLKMEKLDVGVLTEAYEHGE